MKTDEKTTYDHKQKIGQYISKHQTIISIDVVSDRVSVTILLLLVTPVVILLTGKAFVLLLQSVIIL